MNLYICCLSAVLHRLQKNKNTLVKAQGSLDYIIHKKRKQTAAAAVSAALVQQVHYVCRANVSLYGVSNTVFSASSLQLMEEVHYSLCLQCPLSKPVCPRACKRSSSSCTSNRIKSDDTINYKVYKRAMNLVNPWPPCFSKQQLAWECCRRKASGCCPRAGLGEVY